ncbi:4Fe-4S binding protein [Sorangium sp. So ce542]|uniref:4Fe-4S binding protein n=1 Tax=Sorangium sp. So ce542 TaxID=3133316 RepID=UPI003F63FDB4
MADSDSTPAGPAHRPPAAAAAAAPAKASPHGATTPGATAPAAPTRANPWTALLRKAGAIVRPGAKRRPGSGLPARKAIQVLVWVRRAVQAGCLGVFLYFLFQTGFRGSFASSEARVRLPLPVEGFLLADPFVGAMTLLSTHTVYRGLLWSLGILALTLVFGRVFCGWICPFGTLHHFFGWIFPSRYGKGGKRVEANKTYARQRVKYYLMYAFLAASVAGSVIGGLFDPICVAVRAIGLAVIPAAQYVAAVVTGSAAATGSRPVQAAADQAQDFLAASVWQTKQFYFHQAWFVGILFVAILFMNRFIPRFWCRVLCPLGAFLGVFARFALFGMQKDHAKCTDCNLCLVHCQGADSPQGGVKWRQDECHMCLNCENACPEDVIKFRFLPNRKSALVTPDTGRRTALATAAAGAVIIPTARIADVLDANYDHRVIRPPGSVEEREFLERCIRCAECMKVCPNNAIHPAFFEAGIEGLWTPIVIPRIGYCEHSCVLCGDVCPTGAIQKITEEQKMGIGQKPISIGTAFYDQGRCLPWSMSVPCIVCEEFCPTSPKAIWVEEVDIPKREPVPAEHGKEPPMKMVHVQRPHVDPSLCIGCGACEKVCPVQDKPAVYVTSVGETRSKTNVILLEDTDYNKAS